MGRARSCDRAPLSQGWSEWRAAAFSVGRDAADLLPAAVVQPLRSRRRRSALRHLLDARVRRSGARTRRNSRRNDHLELPASLGAPRVDEGGIRCCSELLEARGALLRGGTIVDATLIAASPSTKNEAQKRDPEMRSSKKGNQWYFGMKAHIGVDAKSGLVHTAGVTTGSVHDAKVMDNLVREDDRAVYGDKGYANDRKQRQAEAAGVLWAVKAKAKPGRPLSISQRRRNRRVRENPRQGRARVPGDEMPIRLSQGSLSWHRQERRRFSHCSRSPTYSLPAGHSRPHDEDGGEASPAEGRNNAGTSINDENSAPTSTHYEKVSCSEVP